MRAPEDAANGPVYGVALLSNAMHQDNYARHFARHPRLRIVAVVDEPGRESYVARRNRALADQYGVPYLEGLAALERPEIDAISIGAEIERRGALAVAVAGLGKALWLDKPPVATRAEADELPRAVAAAGVASQVVSFNASRWFGRLRRALDDGALGELEALHLDYHFAKGTTRGLAPRRVPAGGGDRARWTFRDPAITDPTESSHHVIAKRELFEIGWYPLAAAQLLCRRPVRRVYATAGAYFFPEHRDLDLEDFATLTLTLDGGPLVTISTGRTGRASHPGGGRMAARAVGARGTFAIDGGQPPVTLSGGLDDGDGARPTPTALAQGDMAGLAELVDHFVGCLDGARPSLQTAADGCVVVRALLAAYDSVAAGRAVDVT